MKKTSPFFPAFAILMAFALFFTQAACTQNQINQVIADIQVGVDAASVAAPLVLAAFAPGVAAPITAYLGVANQVFADIAKYAASKMTSAQKASAIGAEIATLVAQNPNQVLPPNSPPQLIAEVGAVANAARAVAGLFPAPAMAMQAGGKALARLPDLKPSSAQAIALAQIQAQAQANLAVLAAARR